MGVDEFKLIGGTVGQSRPVRHLKGGGLRIQDRHVGPREMETYAVYIEAKSANTTGERSGTQTVCYGTVAYDVRERKGSQSCPSGSSADSSDGSHEGLHESRCNPLRNPQHAGAT